MNKLKSLRLASLLFSAFAVTPAHAQTNTVTPAPTPQSFLSTAESYFTSFNTNLSTFSTNSPFEFWTGAAYVAGQNVGPQVAFEYKPLPKLPGLTLATVSTMAGIGGTFASQEIDVGWSIVHYDVEMGLGAGVEYNFNGGGLQPGVYAELKKALTQNTFAGVRLEEFFAGNSKTDQPTVSIFCGFTF